MKVLLDTNIVLTYLSGRDDKYTDECRSIMQLCAEEKIEGVIAFHSLSTIWYVTRKAPDGLRRSYIREICSLLTVSGADNQAVLEAVNNTRFLDFEDALQDCCAIEASCDYIITANIKDFKENSMIDAVTPEEFLRLLGA